MLPEQFAILALFINPIGWFFYIKSIIWGHTRPNLVSWFFWMLAPFIGFYFELQAHAGYSALPIFLGGFGPFLVILASILHKKAYWKVTTFDICCGALAGISLALYVLTHNLGISIVFAILCDALGAIPTMVKSWRFPVSESISGYSWCIASNIIGLLVIKNWSFAIYSFGAYFVLLNISLVLILKRKTISSIFFGAH